MSHLHDRVTGSSTTLANFAVGRLQTVSGGRHGYVLPDRRGTVSVDGHVLRVGPDGDERLAEEVLDGLTSELLGSPLTWDFLTQSVPLVATSTNAAEELEVLVSGVKADLPHLRTVVHEPRSRLQHEERLVPVGRARRPARTAVRRLAGHSEDWYDRGFRSVQPRRVLTRRVDLDVDLYENRVAVALLEQHIPWALQTRMRRLQEVEAGLEELTKALRDEGSYLRRLRLSALWEATGDGSAVFDAYAKVAQVLADAVGLRRELQRLRGAPLIESLTGRRPPVGSLRMTNILRDDGHYRGVADLWKLVVEPLSPPEPEAQRRERLEARQCAMAVYVLGLICRNLRTLGCDVRDRGATAEAGIDFDSPWGPGLVRIGSDDVVVLHTPAGTRRFVPWTAPAEVVAGAVPLPGSTTVAYLGSVADAALETLGADADAAVPVNLLEPVATERMGRVVLRCLVGGALASYPPSITNAGQPVPPRLRDELGSLPQVRVSEERTELIEPLGSGGIEEIDRWLEDLKLRGRGHGWERHELRNLSSVRESIVDADRQLSGLLSCPACQVRAPIRAFDRDGDGYLVRCESCHTEWGLARCGSCGGIEPILRLDVELSGRAEASTARELDRLLGRDRLATPCWRTPIGGRDFICSSCGVCGGQAAHADDCFRCMDLERG